MADGHKGRTLQTDVTPEGADHVSDKSTTRMLLHPKKNRPRQR
ncbi:MAG: hypothetical protein PUG12_04165 [Prevotella sp.]|nr:hypothetical protein [Prevotella sp.]